MREGQFGVCDDLALDDWNCWHCVVFIADKCDALTSEFVTPVPGLWVIRPCWVLRLEGLCAIPETLGPICNSKKGLDCNFLKTKGLKFKLKKDFMDWNERKEKGLKMQTLKILRTEMKKRTKVQIVKTLRTKMQLKIKLGKKM